MDEPIERLAEIGHETDRRKWVVEHPELLEAEVVKSICARVVQELASDLARAQNLAEGARFLSEQLTDGYCLGRSRRALSIVSMQNRDFPRALEHAEAALAHFEAIGEDREAAITRSSGLHGLAHLGNHDRAMEWAKKAEDTFVRLGDNLRLARLKLNVGTILARQDRFSGALEHYRSAYETFLKIGQTRDVGTSLRNIAVTLQCDHQLDGAIETYGRAREFCVGNDLPLLVLEIDYNLAYLHYLRGEYARAIELFETGRSNCERLGDRQHMALCDLEQAEIYLELNLFGEAAHLAERARVEFEQLEMGYEVSKSLTHLALAKNHTGEPEAAIRLLDSARSGFEALNNDVWPAVIDLHRADLWAARGDLSKAEGFARKALEVFVALGLPMRAARCRIRLAGLALKQGEADRARELCKRAAEQVDTLKIPAFEFQIWNVSAQIEESSGRYEDAASAYRRAESTLRRLHSRLQTDELKISFLQDKSDISEGLFWLGFQKLGVRPKRLFEDVERAKSRGLSDLLAVRVDTIRSKAKDPKHVDRLRRLRRELNGYYRQADLAEREPQTTSPERLQRLRERISEQEEQLLRALRKVQSTDAELSSLQEGGTTGAETVQAELSEDQLLLEYFIARGNAFVCLVTRHSLEVISLGSAEKLDRLLRGFRYQLSKMLLDPRYVRQLGKSLLRDVERHLKDLFDFLVPPAARMIDAEHWLVVPHGALHYLPFHALYDGRQYLIDRVVVTYAPSAEVYSLCRRRAESRGRGALVMGVADERAPFIHQEVETVAESLPDSKLLEGELVGEESLRSLGKSVRIVHLAAHGHYRQDNPMFSSIQLGRGRLSLFDLYNLELDADLVVLSGCGTGLSHIHQGDELVGLSRGLLYAGSRSVAVSLWDVHDETTAELMGCFYRLLGTEADPASALSGAMREQRDRDPHPYFWAPFVLIGDAFRRSVAGETVAESVVGVEPPAAGFLG